MTYQLIKTKIKSDYGEITENTAEVVKVSSDMSKLREIIRDELLKIYRYYRDTPVENLNELYFKLLDIELVDIENRERINDKTDEDFFIGSLHIEDYINKMEYNDAYYDWEGYNDVSRGVVSYNIIEVKGEDY